MSNAGAPPSGRLRDWVTPPTRFGRTASRVFPLVDSYFGFFRDPGGLEAGDRVVDIGCGWGRMTLPLLDFLAPPGRYHGLDVDEEQVAWATGTITALRQDFTFERIDVRNGMYNSAGAGDGETIRLPLADGAADFIICCSVLTHMKLPEQANYLAEFRRILAPGGRAFISHFLLDDFATGRIRRGLARYNFIPIGTDYATIDIRVQERGIAVREGTWKDMVLAAGLAPAAEVLRGAWCGRSTGNIGQDIAVLERSG